MNFVTSPRYVQKYDNDDDDDNDGDDTDSN